MIGFGELYIWICLQVGQQLVEKGFVGDIDFENISA